MVPGFKAIYAAKVRSFQGWCLAALVQDLPWDVVFADAFGDEPCAPI